MKTSNICMVAYAWYETDTRIMMYAESLVRTGYNVDVIALKRKGQSNYSCINGVKLHRIQTREANEKKKITYLLRILKFFIKSLIILTQMHLKKRYKIIHVHSVPDFLVFTALIPKIQGVKIILDIHDIVPEFYCAKFNVTEKSLIYRCLLLVEKLSAIFSDHVIIANHLWEKKITKRSVKKTKCTTILNYPNKSKFPKKTNKIRKPYFDIIYPGTLNWHQGVDIALKAFNKIKNDVPFARLHIYGEGPIKNKLKNMTIEMGIKDRVFVKDSIPLEKMYKIISNSNLGVVPKRNNKFGKEAFSTKILEFMALGVPVVVSATKIDKFYFNDAIVKYFIPENVDDLARAILCIIKNNEKREKMVSDALKYVENKTWNRKKDVYYDIIKSIN